jgi:hypothetical protein
MGIRFVTTTIDTTALYSPERRGYGTAAIIGFDLAAVKNEAVFIRSLADAAEYYDEDSGIYRSLAMFFANKGKEIWVVVHTGTTQAQELFNGTGSQRDFVVTYFPIPPISVQANLGSGIQAVEEGVHYDMDWSTKTVQFKAAYIPVAGTNNVLVDGYSLSAANALTALNVLAKKSVQVVCISYCFDPVVLVKLKDHLVAAESAGRFRYGFYAMPKALASSGGVDTFLTTLKTDTVTAIAHNSRKDIAAGLMGVFSYFPPQQPITYKVVKDLEQETYFTDTEIATLAGDGGRTSTGKNVLVIDQAERSTLGDVTAWGYTLSLDSALRYIDTIRVLQALQFALEAGLTNPNIIGNFEVDISKEGMMKLHNAIDGILYPYTQRPNKMITGFNVYISLEEIVENDPNITPAERAMLTAAVTSRAVDYEVEIDYRGSINTIAGTVRIVPGSSAPE